MQADESAEMNKKNLRLCAPKNQNIVQ